MSYVRGLPSCHSTQRGSSRYSQASGRPARRRNSTTSASLWAIPALRPRIVTRRPLATDRAADGDGCGGCGRRGRRVRVVGPCAFVVGARVFVRLYVFVVHKTPRSVSGRQHGQAVTPSSVIARRACSRASGLVFFPAMPQAPVWTAPGVAPVPPPPARRIASFQPRGGGGDVRAARVAATSWRSSSAMVSSVRRSCRSNHARTLRKCCRRDTFSDTCSILGPGETSRQHSSRAADRRDAGHIQVGHIVPGRSVNQV